LNPKALQKIPYGLYAVCSYKHGKLNGQIANALFQVTAEPPTIAVSINKKNLTHEYIKSSKVFSASILCEHTPMEFIGNFGFKSGRNVDKFKNVNYKIGKTKAPILLDNCLGYFEAEVIDDLSVGTHTIFIGKIVDADIMSQEKVMTYEYYHEIKGGKSPKNAPTYISDIKKSKIKEVKKMDKYVCSVCGYVYEPEKGDPDNGVAPGTKFDDVPDDWVCPICGASKEAFEKE